MKIYTKTGDRGDTRLVGCQSVKKHDVRVVAYGTLDEVNSHIGLALAHGIKNSKIKADLVTIQHLLFDAGADLATPEGVREWRMRDAHTTWLEAKIDAYTEQTSALTSFILQGGTIEASTLHVARTVARRAERKIVIAMEEAAVNPHVLPFINRLSDYLFTIARFLNEEAGSSETKYETVNIKELL